MYSKKPRKETYIRAKETHMCKESVVFANESARAGHTRETRETRTTCAKETEEKDKETSGFLGIHLFQSDRKNERYNCRSLLQNIVSFIGLFCKRE